MRTIIHRTWQPARAAELTDSSDDPVVALTNRVKRARGIVPIQLDPALLQEMQADEIERELDLQVWMREQGRRQRRRLAKRAFVAEYRDRVRAVRNQRWHEEALAAQRRATSSDAKIAMLHRKTVWMSRSMYTAMAVGLLWSAINVGLNLGRVVGPAGPHAALWVLSFGIEGMISVPILHIMDQATTAARLGIRVNRAKIIAFEAPLLLATLTLNAGPHVRTGDWNDAALFGVAPTMVVVGMWLHSWLADRYAQMIDAVSPVPATGGSPGEARNPAVNQLTTGKAGTTDDDGGEPPSAFAGEKRWAQPASPALQLATWITAPPAEGSSVFTSGTQCSPRTAAPDTPPEEMDPAMVSSGPALDPEDHLRDQRERIARTLIERKESKLSEDHLVSVLRYAQAGWNPNAIATAMSNVTAPPIHRGTVKRNVLLAAAMGLTIAGAPLEVMDTERTA